MNLLFTAPYTRDPMAGTPTLSGVAFQFVLVDADALTAAADFWGIEDGLRPGRGMRVQVNITGTETMTQLLAAFKAAIAAKLNVTFQ